MNPSNIGKILVEFAPIFTTSPVIILFAYSESNSPFEKYIRAISKWSKRIRAISFLGKLIYLS